MDIFDERILSVLKDGKPRLFIQILEEVGFSHNTLKLHLKRMLREEVLVREKTASEGLGRPKFNYTVSPKLKKQVSAVLSAQIQRLKTIFDQLSEQPCAL